MEWDPVEKGDIDMSKFEISFIKDDELMEDIKTYEDIWVVYGSVEIKLNKKKLEFLDNLTVFISYFYLHCLSSLPELYSGQISKFEFEGLFELVFRPKEDDISIYLLEEDEKRGDEIVVPFKEFADEIFRSVSEYLTIILSVRPEFKSSDRTREFQDKIEEFKNLYDHPARKRTFKN